MKEEMRTIGYLCPACRKRVIQSRSVFALSASGAVVSCECGESSLTIDAEENKFRLCVPCGVCGGEHTAECSAEKLLHGRGIGLACPETKMLCCFIGEEYAVEHEMEQLSLAAAKEREQGSDPAAFADSVIMYEILSELKEIAAREVYEQMLRIGEGDLIIGISYPRYSKRTISAMKFARDHGARCLGMTDSKVSPLNEISDVCLYAKSEMVSFLDSLVAPMSLINALIMAVSARDRERTFETFRELETVWKEYEVYGTVES